MDIEEIKQAADTAVANSQVVAAVEEKVAELLSERYNEIATRVILELELRDRLDLRITEAVNAALTKTITEQIVQQIKDILYYQQVRDRFRNLVDDTVTERLEAEVQSVDVKAVVADAIQARVKALLDSQVSDVVRSEMGLIYDELKRQANELSSLARRIAYTDGQLQALQSVIQRR